MLTQKNGIAVLALTLATTLASPAAAKSFKAKAVNGRAHVEVKFEIEKKGTVRELAIKDAERLPLANGNYSLTAVINTATGPVAINFGLVTVRKGKFKKVELRQVSTGTLFAISEVNPPLAVVVTVGNFSLPPVGAAPFRRD